MLVSDQAENQINDEKWASLRRGQVAAATIHKTMVVMQLADQKAQVLIFLNSILVPVCINAMDNDAFGHAATVSILTSVLSILAAMICIYPKRSYRKAGHRDINLLHFNDIGHMEKDDFMGQFMPIFNDGNKLAEAIIHDLYDLSRYSMLPKYFWLKVSYAVFAAGNIIAIIIAVMGV